MKTTIIYAFIAVIIIFTQTGTNAQVCFSPKTSFTSGIDPSSCCSADFNGDGIPDLAIADLSSGSSNISLLLGNGSGGFGAATTFPVGPLPRSVCTADFNGDGKADLATTNIGPGNVSILLGDGAGGFTTVPGFITAIYNNNTSIISADLTGDGKADLVVTSGFNYVLVALGNGDGSFVAPVKITVDNNTHSVVSADFNGDGKADLAVTTYNGSYNVSVLSGNGKGGFGAAANYPVGNSPVSLITADFNGDGYADLATANMVDNVTGNVSILLGNGTGGFAPVTNFGVGVSTVPKSACSADFDGDGKIDLATACITNNNTCNVSVLTGDGTGSFGSPVSFPVDSFPVSVISADFNQDGKMDLASATSKSNIDTGRVSVLLNCNLTGINGITINNKQALLYPNPGNGIFSVKAETEISKIEIINTLGEIIYSAQINSGKREIDLSKQAKGIYFYQLQSDSKISCTGKIIIE